MTNEQSSQRWQRREWDGSDSEDEEQTNQQPGDFWGDRITEEKDPNITRVYFQNINGIKWDREGGSWPGICQAMAGIQADIMGFAEVNQNTAKVEIKKQMEQIATQHFENNRMIMSTSNRQVRQNFKPGGTMMITVMDTVSLAQESTKDRMGRWVSTRYQGQNNRRLTIIMAYQVCQLKRTGRNTAVNQQINMILEESVAAGLHTRRNPRQAFVQDLTNFIRQRQTEGDMILLLGDFNETITENNSGMTTLLAQCNLIDIFGCKFNTTRVPATYKRGSRRLDYALASPELYPMITRSGYDPYDYRGVLSDHRGMYIDLATDELFGDGPIAMAPKARREFTADNPHQVTLYVNSKYDELMHHNIVQRITQLEELTSPDHLLAERIDRDMSRAARKAAKTAAKKPRTPWSPKLAKAWALIHLYRMIQSQLKVSQLNNWAAIREWQTKHEGMPVALPTTLPETELHLKEAYAELKAIRQEAEQHRQEHLADRARLYEALEQMDKAKIVHRIKRAETLHNCYRKLQYARKGEGTSGLVEVQVPVDPTVEPQHCPKEEQYWRTVKASAEIKQILLERNRKHFGQAKGTPLTDPEFVAEVKYDGSGLQADMILEGQYNNPDLDRVSRLFIQHMATKTASSLSPTLTKDEFLGKLKSWPEKTTTSPSGIHLGHYQSLWKRCSLHPSNDSDKFQEFEHKRTLILRVHVALINYALKFGYSYERWQKVVNIMLRKDETNTYIHRLRVIHLYEADYNLVLGVKWREAMFHAEDHNLLNEGLYGSRPSRSAHEPVLIEILQNEVYRASMKAGIHKDLDATSCYDRILAWVANICSRRVGVHPKVAVVNCRTLEKAKYHLKTNIDVSDEFYQHCATNPIYGTGQGSGNSPYLWCFIASTLFDAFATQAHGASFYSYDGQQHMRLFMTGFVDDCSQQVNTFRAHPQPDETQLIQLMKEDAQLWNDLLWSSGGALEIPKCSIQVIQTDWSSRGRPFLRGHCTAPPLIISNESGHLRVKQLSNYQARRSLGVYLSPSGMMNKQFEVLKKQSEKFAETATIYTLTRKEANILFHGIFLPSITYPFAVSSLSDGQCHAIETPFLKVILPRCGYNRSMSRAIRFAPIQYGGAGFHSLHVEQAIQQISTALKHLRSPQRQPGQLLTIALSWAQAHAGVSWSLWQYPEKKIPTIPNPWILAVRKALSKFQAKIVGLSELVPRKLRRNDWFIMDEALSNPMFTMTEIDDINAYRRFYQATTAADIADERGLKIRVDVWEGTGNPTPDEFISEFFNQPRPNGQALRTWKKFQRMIATRDRTFHRPLSDWVVLSTESRRRPPWVYDPAKQHLYYQKYRDQYVKCQMQPRSYQYPPVDITPTSSPPPQAYPVTVIDIGTGVVIRPHDAVLQPTPGLVPTFQHYLATLEPWENQLLKGTQLIGTATETVTMLNDGPSIFIASDGSVVQDKFASFGFTIHQEESKQNIATGFGPVPGSNPSSFRAEAYGVLAVARLLLRLQIYTGTIISQQVTHWIDNQAVVHRLQSELERRYASPNATMSSDWDVINEITHTLAKLQGIKYTTEWIRSHQDSRTAYHNLPLEAQMNCDADTLASAFHDTPQGHFHRPVVPMLPNTRAQLEVNGRTVTGSYKYTLRKEVKLPPLKEYLKHRFGWDNPVLESLDWEVLWTAISPYDDQRSTMVKHVHGIAPTGKYAHRNDSHESPHCPACTHEVETNNHMMFCTANSRQEWREQTCWRVSQMTVQEQQSDTILGGILVEGIQQCLLHGNNTLQSSPYPTKYERVIQEQNAIGWINLFRGRWSKGWRKCQIQWYQEQGISHVEQMGAKWVNKIGRILIDQWWKLWKQRNEERHGYDATTRDQYRATVIHSRLRELYSYRPRIMQIDRNIYPYQSAQEHMESGQTLDSLQDWCTDSGQAILASCSQAEKLGIAGTGDIRLFLTQDTRDTDSVRAAETDGS